MKYIMTQREFELKFPGDFRPGDEIEIRAESYVESPTDDKPKLRRLIAALTYAIFMKEKEKNCEKTKAMARITVERWQEDLIRLENELTVLEHEEDRR